MIPLEAVQNALALPDFDVEAAWQRMAPLARRMRPPERGATIRPAGVLVLLYPHADHLTFVLTKRTDHLATHKGQISLPGGSIETVDSSTWDCALRETCEEIGVCDAQAITTLGDLTPLYVGVSDFEINPHVGALPARPTFIPDPVEVAYTIEMPVQALLDDSIKTTEQWTLHGMLVDVPFYRFQGETIWGATAIILSEFEMRLRRVLDL